MILTETSLYWKEETENGEVLALSLDQTKEISIQAAFLNSSPKLILKAETWIAAKSWLCTICDQENVGKKCIKCGCLTTATISCNSCTFVNSKDSKYCSICARPLHTELEMVDLKIAFRSLDRSVTIGSILQHILEAKRSLEISYSSLSKIAPMGVSAILKAREETNKKRIETISHDSFKDLETLMQKAGEMKKLADSLMSKLGQVQENDGFTDFQKELSKFGVIQPVMKSVAGSRYHLELAEELSNFLTQYSLISGLDQYALSDVFCIFNRARGVGILNN